ncbi:MAG: lysophospholipase [Burkholderiaceae bacterium]|nr:lysophospholipase [Burkholderiaceae bacterium]
MTPEPLTLARPDGIELRGLCWRPPAPAAKPPRTVVVVHGLGEHVGRYAALGAWFGARGWALCGYDHRGHGRSQGARGKVASSGDLVDDLAAAIDALRAPAATPPLLMGQSLGGLVALTYALRHPGRVAGLVLSSPALAPGLSAFQKALLALMSRLAPDVAVNNGLDPTKLSHDPAAVRAYLDDPLVHDRISARLARFIVDGAREALDRAPTLAVPTLLIYAGDDRLVDPEGSREFARRAPRSLLVAREYPALWHEILNEAPAGRDAVLADLEAWLAQR